MARVRNNYIEQEADLKENRTDYIDPHCGGDPAAHSPTRLTRKLDQGIVKIIHIVKDWIYQVSF